MVHFVHSSLLDSRMRWNDGSALVVRSVPRAKAGTQRTSRIVVASHEEEKNNHSKENSVLITKQTETTSTNDNQLIQQSDSNKTLETITKPTTNKGRDSTEK